jgi:hypothetical protein
MNETDSSMEEDGKPSESMDETAPPAMKIIYRSGTIPHSMFW